MTDSINRPARAIARMLSLIGGCCAITGVVAADQNWPQFRGPAACGVIEGADPPIEWNVEQSKNVRWKLKLPGMAHASPIVWGDRVYALTAISGSDDPLLKVGLYGDIAPVVDDTEHEWRIYCVDKSSGEILWETSALKAVPRVKRHTKATHANSTPATDGNHLVTFLGSEGLFCFDAKTGEQKWRKEFGPMDSGYYVVPMAQWGFAASPIIHGGVVYVQVDVQKDSFVGAFDVETGVEIWRTPREEVPTWSTPAVYQHDGVKRLAANGYKHIGGYDLATGKEVWHMEGAGDIPVPTPVLTGDLILLASAHGRAGPLYAVRTSATGDITIPDSESSSDNIAWSTLKNYAYMQTPLVLDDLVYSCTDRGVLSVYDVKTGERLYRERIGDGSTGFTASPVASEKSSDGAPARLYFTSENGEVQVIKAGREFERLSQNLLGEVCMSTPAISGDTLYFRTQMHLIAVAETDK